ncbi:MAG: asparagine synthetase B, partial [Syntrophomonadaceae bacterium]|nr:asparagine synthetase B [Syntrophomonadaceae bacterium]
MCGIAGIIDWTKNLDKDDAVIFKKIQKTLSRRGPDQKGIFIEKSVALIHTRLSVIDIENGRQPMSLEHQGERFVMVYNGELYNTSELRSSLRKLGHIFDGHSDTEVLLHAYAQWREACVNFLNGIFAFAVWERNGRRLFV